jgi:hypothetical protein
MKRSVVALLCTAAIASVAVAGTETYSGKEMKQVAPPPCPQWYADNEFNVSLWGTYIFTGNSWQNDRYLESDHAWGGGADLKYFFHRYFGVGIEGWAVSSRQAFKDVSVDFPDVFPPVAIVNQRIRHEDQTIGAVLGTLTLRYPIPCTRFSPYIFGGGGGIFGGGQGTEIVTVNTGNLAPSLRTRRTDGNTEAIGQVGGGLEFRFTPHIGWVNDFSWNFVDGPHNNFGMVRSGLNFAF